MNSSRKLYFSIIIIVISSGMLHAMESACDTDKQMQSVPSLVVIANSLHSRFNTGKEIKALQWKNPHQLIIMHDLGTPTVWDIQGELTQEKPNAYYLVKSNTNADYSLYDKHGIMAYRFSPIPDSDNKSKKNTQSVVNQPTRIKVYADEKKYEMEHVGMIAALQLFVIKIHLYC